MLLYLKNVPNGIAKCVDPSYVPPTFIRSESTLFELVKATTLYFIAAIIKTKTILQI
jgi:hypothetical protein